MMQYIIDFRSGVFDDPSAHYAMNQFLKNCMYKGFLDGLREMIPEARRSAIIAVDRKAADQTLARNAGHYVLCRCLNGSLTEDNLIHAFIVAMQRSESRYKDDKRALGNKMQEMCFLFAVLFVVRELCRNVVITPDEFVRIVSESIDVHSALDKTPAFFGDAEENGGLQSMFWEAVCVWNCSASRLAISQTRSRRARSASIPLEKPKT